MLGAQGFVCGKVERGGAIESEENGLQGSLGDKARAGSLQGASVGGGGYRVHTSRREGVRRAWAVKGVEALLCYQGGQRRSEDYDGGGGTYCRDLNDNALTHSFRISANNASIRIYSKISD